MDIRSTRCHAAVINGKVLRNIIVSYQGTPDVCAGFEIKPFTGEVHSTDDFNGAVIVMPAQFEFYPDEYVLTPETFSSILDKIASIVPSVLPGESVKLCFLEM